MPNQSERQYKMEIDPKILGLLGPNLYTNIYYVLAELIANAYDANAKNVYVISKADSMQFKRSYRSNQNGIMARAISMR